MTYWGPWAFDPSELILCHEEEDYGIDLYRCTTCAEVLDWIAQIEGKTWGTPDVVGHLVAALCDLLNPQATLCSFGEPTMIDHGQLRGLVLSNEQRTLAFRRYWWAGQHWSGERSKLDRYAAEAGA